MTESVSNETVLKRASKNKLEPSGSITTKKRRLVETVHVFLSNLKKDLSEKCSVGTQTNEIDLALASGKALTPLASPVPWLAIGGQSLPLPVPSSLPPVLPAGSHMLHPAYLSPSLASPQEQYPFLRSPNAVFSDFPPQNAHEMKTLFDKWMLDYQKWFRYMFGADVGSFEETVIHDSGAIKEEPLKPSSSLRNVTSDADLDEIPLPPPAVPIKKIRKKESSLSKIPFPLDSKVVEPDQTKMSSDVHVPSQTTESDPGQQGPTYASTGRSLATVSPAEDFMALNFESLSTSRFARKKNDTLKVPVIEKSVIISPVKEPCDESQPPALPSERESLQCENVAVENSPQMHSVMVGPSTPMNIIYTPAPIVDPYLTLAALAQLSLQNQQRLQPPRDAHGSIMSPFLPYNPPTEAGVQPLTGFTLVPAVNPAMNIVVNPGMAIRNHRNGPTPTMTPWGPLLRYGNYGIFKRNPLDRITKEGLNESELKAMEQQQRRCMLPWDELLIPRANERTLHCGLLDLPPQPPPYILLPKQAMICKLQVPLQTKRLELEGFFRLPRPDSVNHAMFTSWNDTQTIQQRSRRLNLHRVTPSIDYVATLKSVVMNTINLPVRFFFSQLKHLPSGEKSWYWARPTVQETLPLERSLVSPPLSDMFICDVLIGDVFITQVLADWKRMARELAAKEAFNVLSQPSFIAGSLRSWYGNQFMVVCLSHKPGVIPLLPPFVSDPTEPMYKKDQCLDEGNRREHSDIMNPQPLHEFWLYAGPQKNVAELNRVKPSVTDLSPLLDYEVQRWLRRSTDFSQMQLSYQINVLPDGRFRANLMVDKDCAAMAEAGTIYHARKAAAFKLLQRFATEAAIVGYAGTSGQNCNAVPTEEEAWTAMVWGGSNELKSAISLKEVAFHIRNEDEEEDRDIKPLIWDESLVAAIREHLVQTDCVNMTFLETILEVFAASSHVTPLYVEDDFFSYDNWSHIKIVAHQLGLIAVEQVGSNQIDPSEQPRRLVFAKRVPLARLKKTLLERSKYGELVLIQRPTSLPDDYIERTADVMCVIDDTESDKNEEISCVTSLSHPSTPNQDVEQQNHETVLNSENRHLEGNDFNFYKEPDSQASLTFALNSSDNFEILDDLPRSLIPGIDF